MPLNAELRGAAASSSSTRARLAGACRNRAISVKAISFALIGAVNTAVDYSAFLLARAALKKITASFALFAAPSSSRETLLLIAANTIAWLIATTGSYIMNSSITFCSRIGRKLRWRVTPPSPPPALPVDGQYGNADLWRAGFSVADLGRQGRRNSGELHRQFFAIALRRFPATGQNLPAGRAALLYEPGAQPRKFGIAD